MKKEDLIILTEAYTKGFGGKGDFTNEELKEAKEYLHIVNKGISEDILKLNFVIIRERLVHEYFIGGKNCLSIDTYGFIYNDDESCFGKVDYVYQLILVLRSLNLLDEPFKIK